MSRVVVADTGPLFALINQSDSWHEPVIRWWREHGTRVVVCSALLPELCYLLHTRVSPLAEIDFLRGVLRNDFVIETTTDHDLVRAAELMRKYADHPLGYVDASVMAMAERLGTRTILTTDRRHFGAVRDRKGRALELVP